LKEHPAKKSISKMSDSDMDYDGNGSDDDGDARDGANASSKQGTASRPRGRAQAKWEAMASRTWDVQDGADGALESMLGGIEEAAKRKRSG
jgi:transcription initiation factor TFIIH subunit 2